MAYLPTMTHQVQNMIQTNFAFNWSVDIVAHNLLMSAATLRRKLKLEKTYFHELKKTARLVHGLHLLQTTELSFLEIANRCGYQSQSRFTDQFKQLFNITPSHLKK